MNVRYKELSDRAFYYHSNNDLDKAEELYLLLLSLNCDDSNILNLLGMLYVAKKNYEKAIYYISKAFLIKQTPYIATNLAKAYFLNEDIDKSVTMYNTAISLGESDDLYYSLAIAYKKQGNFDQVISCYKKALKLNPKNYNASYNLSNMYNELKDYDNAIIYAKQCLNINNNKDEIYSMLSEYYQYKGMLPESIDYLAKATQINNRNYLYFYNLGTLYIKYRKENESEFLSALLHTINYQEKKIVFIEIIGFIYSRIECEYNAIEAYKSSITINPKYKKSYINAANILKLQNKTKNCIDLLNLMIEINPDSTEVFGMLASLYMETCEYEKALEYYEKAIEVSGEDSILLNGKAAALKYLGKIPEAKAIYENLIKTNLAGTKSKISLGSIYLSEKNFNSGWELYRLRNLDTNLYKFYNKRIFEKGNTLDGKNILLYSNCGFGDTIMYSRYLNLLKTKAKSVTLQTDSELIQLLKNNFNDINIVNKGKIIKDYDVLIPLMDVQYALKTDFNDIPFSKGYLKAVNNHIINTKNKKIGLFWKGSDIILNNRSIPYELLSNIYHIENYSFYSFQPDIEVKEITNLKNYIKNFNDTANLLTEMDILITIDSAIVHLAGALGIKTYLMLPYYSEWRWFNDTKKTPWYDSVQIFKQKKYNDPNSVIESIQNELINNAK